MSWKLVLPITLVVFTQVVPAYELTRYWVNSTTARATYTYLDSTSTRFSYSSYEVKLPGSATPSILSITSTPGPLVTMITAWIHQDAGGTQVPQGWDRPERPELYVTVTFNTCYSYGDDRKPTWLETPVTRTASLYLETDLSDFLVPTTTIGTMALIDPSDLDPIHLASASYRVVPTSDVDGSCRRETSALDYRSLCTSWYMTSKEVTTMEGTRVVVTTKPPPTRTAECGEMNLCCHGCHGWGYGFPFPDEASFLICEDGRELELNGTERPDSGVWDHARNNSDNGTSREPGIVIWGLGMAFLLTILAAL